jgi:predicted metalloprotease
MTMMGRAFASAKKRVAGTDGTVLFGQRFLKKLMASPEAPDATVAGVCAHEFGHILQYKLGLDKDLSEGQPTVKRVELNADFFAGYYAGVRKRESPKFNAAVIALTQFNSGDNMVKNPAHHGTPAERGKAIVKGYQTGHDDRKQDQRGIRHGQFLTPPFPGGDSQARLAQRSFVCFRRLRRCKRMSVR